MKTSSSSRNNRFFSFIRATTITVLLSAAAAMAFVSIAPPSLPVAGKSTLDEDAFGRFGKFRQDRDQLRASPGVERDGTPRLAAEEDFANRAYPATDIPFSATLNAHAAFKKVKARSTTATSSTSGTWTLLGPSPE